MTVFGHFPATRTIYHTVYIWLWPTLIITKWSWKPNAISVPLREWGWHLLVRHICSEFERLKQIQLNTFHIVYKNVTLPHCGAKGVGITQKTACQRQYVYRTHLVGCVEIDRMEGKAALRNRVCNNTQHLAVGGSVHQIIPLVWLRYLESSAD
jgi:hypothetical protein